MEGLVHFKKIISELYIWYFSSIQKIKCIKQIQFRHIDSFDR